MPVSFMIGIRNKDSQTPQGCLAPASQERGIRPNLTSFGAGLHDAGIGECSLHDSGNYIADSIIMWTETPYF